MRILAIESSGLVASAAIAEDDRLVAEYTMNNKQTHSQTLLPMVDEIMRAAGLSPKELDAIAVSKGPGSFTGLRIGSATAKGLGLALDIPLIEVSTLEALAYNLCMPGETVVCPIMDARRQEVYSAVYSFEAAQKIPRPVALVDEEALPLTDVINRLNSIGRPVVFTGDAVPVYPDIIKEKIKLPYYFAPRHMSRQRAGAVAELACLYYAEGKTVPAQDHVPTYLRLSQAERNAASGGKD